MDLFQAIEAGSAAIGAVSVVYATARGVHIFKGHLELSRRALDAEAREHAAILREQEARDAAQAFRLSSDGWQSAVEMLGTQVLELKNEIAHARADVALAREQIRLIKTELGSAVLYISDLIVHIRSGGKPETLPPIPADLQEAVTQSLRERGGSPLS